MPLFTTLISTTINTAITSSESNCETGVSIQVLHYLVEINKQIGKVCIGDIRVKLPGTFHVLAQILSELDKGPSMSDDRGTIPEDTRTLSDITMARRINMNNSCLQPLVNLW